MLSRALTVAVAAAGLALVPAAASATPEQAPVENYMSTQYYGTATVAMSGDRTAEISLMEDRSTGPEARASLYVSMHREAPCPWGSGVCSTDRALAFVSLRDEQVEFDRNLGRAAVTDLPVEIVRYGGWPTYTPTVEHVTISVVLTGTGPVSRDADHATECPMGGECQSIRVEASRAAVSTVTFGDESGSGVGRLFRGHSVNAAAPKFYDGGN